MYDIILSIVEAKTVPCRMFVTVTGIEILIRITCQIAQPFHLILHGMGMHNIHNDGNALLMRCIDKCLQLFGRSKSARRCEERTHMISKTAIIRMLLDSHHLHAVITILHDAWKHMILKLGIGTHFLCILRHAYMAFIDEQRILGWTERLHLPLVSLFRCPHLCREDLCPIVLHDTCSPCRDALALSPIPFHMHLKQISMLHGTDRKP